MLARAIFLILFLALPARADFLAGAATVDVTPEKLPVIVNGSFVERTADAIHTRLHARSIYLSDGKTELAIVVVDSCMMPREPIDEAKAIANKQLGIPTDRILIAATHTHTAPASMGCLGTTAGDPTYVPLLRNKLVETIAAAKKNLQPARIGVVVPQAPKHTAVRRWIRRPDRIDNDPFGNPTVRANMHAANNWDNVIGVSGPEDPDLSLVSIQTKAGAPLAVLANFSMHYFSDKAISADYFGLYAEGLKQKLAPDSDFVAMMSHGCSGDVWKRDYSKAKDERRDDQSIDSYANELVEISVKALKTVTYQDDVNLDMRERRLQLNYRLPDAQRLAWAKQIVADMGNRPPKTRPEVYAREQIYLHEKQSTEVVLQAVRIGDFALATTPTETYALTGLKIKRHSPFDTTVVFDLTNGGDGYIPPAEQHLLGGYNTWPARSAGLEVEAEPKMTEAIIGMLEALAEKPRREPRLATGPAAKAILKLKPALYYRCDEMAPPRALDFSTNTYDGIYEDGVVYYLPGPHADRFCQDGEKNRAVHFAGGRIRSRIPLLGDTYTVSLWFWNGMPVNGRDITGWIFGRETDAVGIAGKAAQDLAGVLMIGSRLGRTTVERWTWNHLAVVRDRGSIRIYLNGTLEIEADRPAKSPRTIHKLFFGGRADPANSFEGRLDEIAVFRRALKADEVKLLAKP
jgi:hypothetical protein